MMADKGLIRQACKNVIEWGKKNKSHILVGLGFGGVGAAGAYALAEKKNEKEVSKAFKEGYAQASAVYEERLNKLTEAFLSKEKSYEQDRMEYDNLLIEYENEIERLETKVQKTEEEVIRLRLLIDRKTELLSLKTAV